MENCKRVILGTQLSILSFRYDCIYGGNLSGLFFDDAFLPLVLELAEVTLLSEALFRKRRLGLYS